MTRLVDPELVDPQVGPRPRLESRFNISPDRTRFVISTRKGNIAANRNEYALTLFDTRQVLDFVNADGSARRPEGRRLAQLATTSNEPGIRQIGWLDGSRRVAFVGENDGRPGQLYSIDIATGQSRRLTDHPRAVASFDVNLTTGTLVYASTVAHRNEGCDEPSFVVGAQHFEAVSCSGREIRYPRLFQLYIRDIGGNGAARPIGQPFAHLWPPKIWVSPSGRWVVTTTSVPEVPAAWSQGYDPIRESKWLSFMIREYDPTTMRPDVAFLQFALIDLADGSIAPLLDAPAGNIGSGLSVATWLPDGNRVVLANTFLPLDVTDPEELARRRRGPAIVEYAVDSGQITWIADLADSVSSGGRQRWRVSGMTLEANDILVVERRSAQGDLPAKRYRKIGSRWVELITSDGRHERCRGRLELSVHQDLTIPPDIMARDCTTRRRKVITDLNPRLQGLTLGRTEVIEWSDRTGAAWYAGLIYPPGYEAGRRYPLVIQTHGFYVEEFLVDGPYGNTAPYAAQPLANKGIMVVQVPDLITSDVAVGRSELEGYRQGIEALIDEIDARGLIDRQRIGLVGWSGLGAVVQHLLVFSDYEFAAATIADAYNTSMAGYAYFYGLDTPGMVYIERAVGGTPWGDGLATWVAQNPVFHLDRLHTPLRVERYVPGFVQWWDTYTILRRLHKPVEFLIFPDAPHTPIRPAQRLASQQGNVDWFTFWLKGEEDPDPTKVEQYVRWRELRDQHEADLRHGHSRATWPRRVRETTPQTQPR